MIECYGIAGQWNAQRTKTTDRVWSYTDFHPDHFQQIKKPKSGSEVVQDVVCMISGDGFTWAPGYGPEVI